MDEYREGNDKLAKYVSELTLQTMKPKDVGPSGGQRAEVIVVPKGCEALDLRNLLPIQPDRIRQKVVMVDVASFVKYVNEHKDSTSRMFASVLTEQANVTCVLDYHGAQADEAEASFCTHTCRLDFTPTDAWLEWRGKNNKPMTQEEFAKFIEERQKDVVDPKGADMLELARSIEATQGVSFKRRIRLENGDVSFTFDDKTEATAGLNGQLRIPEVMVLKIPIFLGMPEMIVNCRFRYRLDGGRLILWYEIVRAREFLLETCRKVLEVVEEETKVTAFLGSTLGE